MSQGMLGNLPLSEVRGPKGDLDEKLAGSDGAMWLTAFKRFLRKKNPWPTFPVRWIVTLGVYKTPEAYEQALESAGFDITHWACSILKKITCSKEQIGVHLASATVAELGLPNGGTTTDVNTAIKVLGYLLCPAEVGPALRLFLKDQPKSEWLWIAMEAISDSDDDLNVFYVIHVDDDLCLGAGSGRPVDHWNPDSRIVFVAPSQVS